MPQPSLRQYLCPARSHSAPFWCKGAFADFFNDINAVRDDIHKDIQRQSKRVEAISKLVQKKLNL